jgi:hypothetical protein
MDVSDASEREVDNAKEVLASKLAVILFMECEARIDDWLDRELMSRLAQVLSLEEGRDEVVDGSGDEGGVDLKLAVILLPFIKVEQMNPLKWHMKIWRYLQRWMWQW